VGDVIFLGPAVAWAGVGPVNAADGGREQDPGGVLPGLAFRSAENDGAGTGIDGAPGGQLVGGGQTEAPDGGLEGRGARIGSVAGGGIDSLGIDRLKATGPFTSRVNGDTIAGFVPGFGVLVGKEGGILSPGRTEMLEGEVTGEDGVLAEGEEIAGGAGGGRIRFS